MTRPLAAGIRHLRPCRAGVMNQPSEQLERAQRLALVQARAVLDRREAEALRRCQQDSQLRQIAPPVLWSDAGWMR